MSQTSASTPSSRKRWIKPAIQIVVLILVAVGIWRTVSDARDKFAAANFAFADVDAAWLLGAGVFYGAGMFPSCLFWHRTLRTMGQQPRFLQTLQAFYIGHLGKYVPGKALVVVIRTGLIRGSRVDTAVAATSVFVETLTMMAVGATMAALILALQFREQHLLLALAVCLAACAGIPTVPPLFRRIVAWLQVRRANPAIDQAVAQLNFSLMAYGWLTISLGWFAFGLSLWATIRAMPGNMIGGPFEHLTLLTACVGLALVAGFLSLLPGGVGVRELVVMTLIAPVFGEVVAIVSAVLLRVVWLLTELVIAALLFPLRVEAN
jgi:hypothetical protein